MWEWQADEFSLHEDVPKSLWNDVSQDEDLSYMLGESDTTPIKACEELSYHAADTYEIINKDMELCRGTSSQVKRRRMLQFDSEISELPICNEPNFLKSKDREDTLEEAFSGVSQWISGEDASSSGYENMDPSSEGWLADCFNDADLHFNSGDLDRSGASDLQNAELCDNPPEHEATTVQKRCTRTRKNIVFKGKKSYGQSPTKMASSVVYPFAFIKPCGFQGDVTLRDINQRICTPPKHKEGTEDPSESYPTSAFSGKPVVVKTKIHTEGGKGCITIMRTKG